LQWNIRDQLLIYWNEVDNQILFFGGNIQAAVNQSIKGVQNFGLFHSRDRGYSFFPFNADIGAL